MQQHIAINGPILPGSITTARSRCGKPSCACHKGQATGLHGPYYRWTGFVGGKRTTKTLSKDTALECARRIRNFRKLRKEIDKLVLQALANAPWMSQAAKSRKGALK
jgi:hypothetical protein